MSTISIRGLVLHIFTNIHSVAQKLPWQPVLFILSILFRECLGNYCIEFLRRQYEMIPTLGVQNLATRVLFCSCALVMPVWATLQGAKQKQQHIVYWLRYIFLTSWRINLKSHHLAILEKTVKLSNYAIFIYPSSYMSICISINNQSKNNRLSR